ncbi:MAG: class B sortase [Clostridia bacterium]|nr:class B sortase [Clostridia bacterium]
MKKNKILIIIFAVIFLISAIFLVIHLIPEKNDFDKYKNDTSEVESVASKEEEIILPDNPIDFAKLEKQNDEIIGWLNIPDTIIDYPILQSGIDTKEDFYLDKDINKKYKSAGSLYIQKMNYDDFSDPNTIIYGHNMLNGTMFGTLKRFRNSGYFNNHDTMYVYIPGHILTYRIYSAFIYDDRHILNSFEFYNKESYEKFLSETLDPVSMTRNVRKGVEVTTEDKIITLSTCTSRATERYLVLGVLINDQPTK